MAHHKSAKKRILRNEKRYEINHARKHRARTFMKKVEVAIAGGNYDEAQAALSAAAPEIIRAAQKGALEKNAAARKVSRLNARVKALQAAA